MGILGGVASIILRFFMRKLEAEMVKKIFPIVLFIFFSLLGLYFLALAALDFLGLFLPAHLAKILLAIAFFVLAAISKLWW
jgi:hypothetical protein